MAEAEDHLRETAAAGLAIGMTEREAQEAAISSFGPVRAVVRAHHARRGWLAAAGEGGLAAWKLASILVLTSGVTGLAIATILTIWPPVAGLPSGVPTQVPVPIFLGVSDSLWLAWAVAAAGGAILLAGCALTLRRRRRRGRGMLLGGFFPMVAAGFLRYAMELGLSIPSCSVHIVWENFSPRWLLDELKAWSATGVGGVIVALPAPWPPDAVNHLADVASRL